MPRQQHMLLPRACCRRRPTSDAPLFFFIKVSGKLSLHSPTPTRSSPNTQGIYISSAAPERPGAQDRAKFSRRMHLLKSLRVCSWYIRALSAPWLTYPSVVSLLDLLVRTTHSKHCLVKTAPPEHSHRSVEDGVSYRSSCSSAGVVKSFAGSQLARGAPSATAATAR
jgi:hypothetical protein